MKVARPITQAAAVKSANDQMEARGFNPIARLMDMIDEEIDEPDTGDGEADKAILRSMLCTDYEPAGAGKLRLRARLRMEGLMELARYAHPRLKATDNAGPVNNGVIVNIKSYTTVQK